MDIAHSLHILLLCKRRQLYRKEELFLWRHSIELTILVRIIAFKSKATIAQMPKLN